MSAEIYREFSSMSDIEQTRYYLAHGADSVVYKSGEHVVKVYDVTRFVPKSEPLDLEIAARYCYITNKISDFAAQTGLTHNFLGKDLKIIVNPIVEMIFDNEIGICVGVSPVVLGPNIHDIRCGNYSKEDLIHSIPWIDAHMIDGIREIPYTVFRQRSKMDDLEAGLEKIMQVEGLSIGELNIKPREDGLVITHLCCNITKLRDKAELVEHSL